MNRQDAQNSLSRSACVSFFLGGRSFQSAGIADVYTFRYDGFGNGDYIKIQFNGESSSSNNGGSGGASFAGLLFDFVPGAATAIPEPATLGMFLLGGLSLATAAWRRRGSLSQLA